MGGKPNERSALMAQGIKPGDCLEVHFNSNLSAGLAGFVIVNSPERLRIKAHCGVGSLVVEDATGCLNWDVVIPWTAIGFARHTATKPVGCECQEDLA